MDFKKKLWIGILVLALLSPVGIILPLAFDAGDAWGEWSAETIEKLIGFIPEKLKANSDIWNAPMQDYNLGSEESPLWIKIFSYILSGIVGVAIIAILLYAVKKIMRT